ncbi:OX-2 membrane glycoprotein-like isoform X2 [Notolabrus celidotus]|uniref:OX-2 membrane glycoprotein-like isoform X2 n=1 Tax=Notolabrus celidotus TaxID=1203425 RepID=UPI0014904F7E|nr:OX-2 membrane glycoprotein-like isoform X2 [Notolabrus celidotus]
MLLQTHSREEAMKSAQGLAALIQTERTVMAAAGEQACLNCKLLKSKQVHQVTWQKVLPDGERNVATYNIYSGQRVNAGYKGKVQFKYVGLQNSSIVIQDVTEQDEGCYRCLFNTWPDGALICSTCLKLYELHEPVLHFRESNVSQGVIVSCSATARPTPTVTLRVLHHELKSSIHKYSNDNGTVTVIATAVLPHRNVNNTEVECEVHVPLVDPKKVVMPIPEVKLASGDGPERQTGSEDIDLTWVIPVVLVFLLIVLCSVLFSVYLFWKRKQLNRPAHKDPEVIKTPAKPAEPEIRSPLLQELDEQSGPRLRTSTVKKGKTKDPSVTPPERSCRRPLFNDKKSP